MIAGFYYDQKPPQTDKIPAFYLPNKSKFKASIGLNFENVLSKSKCINEEIIIFANFCEIVGPLPLIIYPNKTPISPETIDMIVLKAMSVDYQSCELGDFVLDTTTQTLILDCSIPFFVHYFTLWDIYARGYVRPCCIIVCCRDKTRARELFIATHKKIIDVLRPILMDNVAHFYQELRTSKEVIDKMLFLNQDDPLFECEEFDSQQLIHLQREYGHLITNILAQTESLYLQKASKSGDLLLDIGLATTTFKRELRSIYLIMGVNEADMINLLTSISKMFSDACVSESFSLTEFDPHCDANSAFFNPVILGHGSKFDFKHFYTDVGKSSPLCQCRTLYDNMTDPHEMATIGSSPHNVCPLTIDRPMAFLSRDVPVDMLFPNLHNIKSNQCHLVSHQCKQLGVSVVTKLIGCLFNQCNLIILINIQQSYLQLMSFLLLFLPKAHNSNYFTYKVDWPNLDQLKESPVLLLNKDSKSAEIPIQLQGFVAIYDYTTNQFLSGPKYCKGHLSNFFDSFKYLEYNHLHLETVVNIMLLNYVDMIYQWANFLGRRDRRWITEDYFIKLGNTLEDITISEKLTLLVFQTLVKSKQNSNEANLFLTTKCLCNMPVAKKDK